MLSPLYLTQVILRHGVHLVQLCSCRLGKFCGTSSAAQLSYNFALAAVALASASALQQLGMFATHLLLLLHLPCTDMTCLLHRSAFAAVSLASAFALQQQFVTHVCSV